MLIDSHCHLQHYELAERREVVARARTHVANLAHFLKTPLSVIANEVQGVSGPLAELSGNASAEIAAAGASGVARALQAMFRFLLAVANALPFAGAAIVLAGIALGVVGWLGNTTLVLDFAGSERVYPVRGRNTGLLDFSEAVSERLMSLKR